MDKIWDRKSFEVWGHWPLWWGWKKEWPRRTDKSRTLKKIEIGLTSFFKRSFFYTKKCQ